ncbi:hypothetical protein P3S67_001418 [Capsicum chacoense]
MDPKILGNFNSGDCNMWWDDWTEIGSLAIKCPAFMNGNGRSIMVKEIMINGSWDMKKHYNTLPGQIALYIGTTDIGEPNDMDYAVWSDTENGQYMIHEQSTDSKTKLRYGYES